MKFWISPNSDLEIWVWVRVVPLVLPKGPTRTRTHDQPEPTPFRLDSLLNGWVQVGHPMTNPNPPFLGSGWSSNDQPEPIIFPIFRTSDFGFRISDFGFGINELINLIN